MATYYRTDEPTPSGGDYSEIYFFDDKDNNVDETVATKCVIRECKANGDLIMETFAGWGRGRED